MESPGRSVLFTCQIPSKFHTDVLFFLDFLKFLFVFTIYNTEFGSPNQFKTANFCIFATLPIGFVTIHANSP